jgi:23S rRNA pseudouridine2457 synthase
MARKQVKLASRQTKAPLPYRYVLFYKPYNVLCQFTDRDSPKHGDRLTLKSYISIPDIYAVGRLDYDSEGLLLLTNHGQLQHRLSDPKFRHPRTYWVQVEQVPKDADLQPLRQGIAIQDYRTRPAQVELLPQEPPVPPRDPPIRDRKNIPTAWLAMTLTEGRNRQVRRMTAAIGFPTLRLVRAAIGDLNLAGLNPGEWRDLTRLEVNGLKEVCRIY